MLTFKLNNKPTNIQQRICYIRKINFSVVANHNIKSSGIISNNNLNLIIMAFLKKDQIEEIVKIALKEVADFNGDIKNYEFKHFHEFHKKVFLSKLKGLINKSLYYRRDGNTDNDRYYDVPLSMSLINSWKMMIDCIDYIYDNQAVYKRSPNNIQL